jgi:hypothetical protein
MKINMGKKTYKAKNKEHILRNQELSPKNWHVIFCIYTILQFHILISIILAWWWQSPNIRRWS